METYSLITQLVSGEITAVTGIIWILASILLGAAGGAVAGWKLGAKDIGNELALLMGAFFGPLASVPGVLLGLIVLKLI